MFNLPNGNKAKSSLVGCICTIFLTLACVFYGVVQIMKMYMFEDTDIMISSRDAFFDPDYIYSENLMYSFGITAYDSNPEVIEDPSYG